MPKEISHILFADDVESAVDAKTRRTLAAHRSAYYFGSVAPDLFYYDVPLPGDAGQSAEKWGGIIHGKDGEDNNRHVLLMLDAIRDAAAAPRGVSGRDPETHRPTLINDARLAFVCGYLTHVALDTFFHPLVYSVSGNYFHEDPAERRRAEARHRTFESCLDLFLLSEKGMQLGDFGLIQKLALPRRLRVDLVEFYAGALSQAYEPGYNLGPFAERAFRKSRWMTRLFVSRTAFRFFSRIERLLGADWSHLLNLFYAEKEARGRVQFLSLPSVPHPVTGRPYPGNVHLLIDRARKRAVQFLRAATAYTRGRANRKETAQILKSYSLNNGIVRMPTERNVHTRMLPRLESWKA